MFHEPGQRHLVRRRQLAYRELAFGERLEDAAARGIGERGEHNIEAGILILNHQV